MVPFHEFNPESSPGTLKLLVHTFPFHIYSILDSTWDLDGRLRPRFLLTAHAISTDSSGLDLICDHKLPPRDVRALVRVTVPLY